MHAIGGPEGGDGRGGDDAVVASIGGAITGGDVGAGGIGWAGDGGDDAIGVGGVSQIKRRAWNVRRNEGVKVLAAEGDENKLQMARSCTYI